MSKSSSVSNFELKHKAKKSFLNLPGILLMRNVKRLKTSHSVPFVFLVFFFVVKQMACCIVTNTVKDNTFFVPTNRRMQEFLSISKFET